MNLRKFLSLGILLVALLAQPLQFSAAASSIPDEVVFDFVAGAQNAQWRSGSGSLPFPGTSGDFRGFAQQVDAPVLEDGSVAGTPGLLTVPQLKYDGYIQGVFPEFTVQKGDHFRANVGCEYRAYNCYVTFRLDYLTPGGATFIVWKWKEKNEGRTYLADVDLSPLAGKTVRFVLTMLATGYADGDRPLWGAPRIVRLGDGRTPLPTLTPTSTPFASPPPVTPAGCNKAAFVTDITVRDGTTFTPGAAFTKGWRLRNDGSCTWGTDYTLVYYNGDQLGAPTATNLPWVVAPGQTVDLAINAVAPAAPGHYRGYWILRSASGSLFGIGSDGTSPIWVDINVGGSAPTGGSNFDFVANACSAQWRSGAGSLPCPGTDGDARGFMLVRDAPRLEDGSTASAPGLLTMPQGKYDGYLQGVYPTFTIQPGDRFQAVVGCEYGSSCYVTYRLDYLTPGGATKIVWQWKEKNEGRTYAVDVDLTPWAGQSVRFMLTMLATGFSTGDRALWVAPRIVRANNPTITPQPPTVTGVRVEVKKPDRIVCGGPNFVIINGYITANQPMTVTYHWELGGDKHYTSPDINMTFETAGTQFAPLGEYRVDCGNFYAKLIITSPNATSAQMDYSVYPPGTVVPSKTPTLTPTVTATPTSAPWPTYINTRYNFQIGYPPDGHLGAPNELALATIYLPVTPGTSLVSKYLSPVVSQSPTRCANTLGGEESTVIFNGVTFLKQIGAATDGGTKRQWLSYSTQKEATCLSLNFWLISNPDPALTPYNLLTESAIFEQMLATFAWRAPATTGTVTGVTVNAATPAAPVCGGPNLVAFHATFTADGPTTVTYHWEISGDKVSHSADETLVFASAGTIAVDTDAYKVDCGNYLVTLVVTSPNTQVAQWNFSVQPTPTATPTPAPVNVLVYFTDRQAFTNGIPPYEKSVVRSVTSSNLPEAVLTEMFKGPTEAEKALGLELILSGATGFSSLQITNGIAHVYLTGNCNSNGAMYTIGSLIFANLKQFPQAQIIRIYDQNGNTGNPDPTANSIPACLEP